MRPWLTECSRHNLGQIENLALRSRTWRDFSQFQETGPRTVEPTCRRPTSARRHNRAKLRITNPRSCGGAGNSDLAITDHVISLSCIGDTDRKLLLNLAHSSYSL